MTLEDWSYLLGSIAIIFTSLGVILGFLFKSVYKEIDSEAEKSDLSLENQDGKCKGRNELLKVKIKNLEDNDQSYHDAQKTIFDKIDELAGKFVTETQFDREIKHIENRIDGKKK